MTIWHISTVNLDKKPHADSNCCCNYSLLLLCLLDVAHFWIMNAAILLQAAFFAAAFRFLQFAYNSVGQRKVTLCRLIDHKYVSFPSPPSLAIAYGIWHGNSLMPLLPTYIANWNYVAANVWIVNVFLASLPLGPFCQLAVAFARCCCCCRCRFFKFFMLQFSQIPRALHVPDTCVWVCVCLCVSAL